MKNIFKLMAAFAATALLLPACNVDNVNATYTDYSNSEVTFSQSVIVATELSADATSFTIELSRNNAKDAVTVSIDNSKVPAEFNCPNSVSFAAGEYKAELLLNLTNLAVGTKVTGTLAILTPEAVNANVAKAITVNFTLAKAYVWENYGWCNYTDDIVTAFFGLPEIVTYPVYVEKAQGFDVFRITDLYGETYPYNDPGDYTPGSKVTINANDHNNVIFDQQNLGFDWGYGEWYAWSLKGGTYANGVITFPVNGLAVGMPDAGETYANGSGMFKLDLNNPKNSK